MINVDANEDTVSQAVPMKIEEAVKILSTILRQWITHPQNTD